MCLLLNNLHLKKQIANKYFDITENMKNNSRSVPEKLHASRKQSTAISRHLPAYPPYFTGSVKALTAAAEGVQTYFVQERTGG